MLIEWNLILRLFVAGLLGGLIGFEREVRAKDVGVRTHFIVALGSALFMLISQYAFSGRFDAARVAAQVVSGIGFIGAGVIIFQKNVVRGITTASALWVAAAIGLACGAGMYAVSLAAALMTIICLETMHFITRRYGEKNVDISVHPADNRTILSLMGKIQEAGYPVESFTIHDGVADLMVRIHPRDHEKLVKMVLENTEGLGVDIS